MYNDAILYPALAAPAVTGSFTASFAPGAPKLGLSFDPSDVTSMVAIKVDPEGQAFAAGARVGCTILSVGDAVDLQGVGDFRDAVRRYQADPSLPCVITFSNLPPSGNSELAAANPVQQGSAGKHCALPQPLYQLCSPAQHVITAPAPNSCGLNPLLVPALFLFV